MPRYTIPPYTRGVCYTIPSYTRSVYIVPRYTIPHYTRGATAGDPSPLLPRKQTNKQPREHLLYLYEFSKARSEAWCMGPEINMAFSCCTVTQWAEKKLCQSRKQGILYRGLWAVCKHRTWSEWSISYRNYIVVWCCTIAEPHTDEVVTEISCYLARVSCRIQD